MNRSRRQRYGFAYNEPLILISVVLLSLAILLPVVQRLIELGFSWWLSIALGLIPVALFWVAFTAVAAAIAHIVLWVEKRQR